MNSKTIVAAGVAAAAFALSVFGLVSGLDSTSRSAGSGSAIHAAELTELPLVEVPLIPSAETLYILKEYDGQIAVFVPDAQETPVMLTGILASSLRKADRQQLQSGISVWGEEELAKLLEDFGS